MSDLLDPNIRKEQPEFQQQRQIPKAIGVLIVGCIALTTCMIYGVPGIVMGAITMHHWKTVKQYYIEDPGSYEKSYKMARVGYRCGVAAFCVGIAFLGTLLIVFTVAIITGG